MANRNLRKFQADGCLWLVNLAHDAAVPGGIYGPFFTERQVRAARALVPDHERSNAAANLATRPQVSDERDINPLTR
jgi:hypothetical protein